MTTFLSKILETKRAEVERLQPRRKSLQDAVDTMPQTRGFLQSIVGSSELAVVAEIKKASPSKGVICEDFNPVRVAQMYESAGASAISVLTDESYFQGSMGILKRVRDTVHLPILRKDFIIDELQILEARAGGADAVLLICAALAPDRLRELSAFAQTLELDVLIEVHTLCEVEAAVLAEPSVIGINNRNLHTFEVNLEVTESCISIIPSYIPVLSESGIHNVQDANRMAMAGADGVLVGESLMRLPTSDAVHGAIHRFQVCRPRTRKVGHSV